MPDGSWPSRVRATGRLLPWLMQPALVIGMTIAIYRNPNLLLFNKDLAPNKLLAQRNLAVGSDDFDARGVGNGA